MLTPAQTLATIRDLAVQAANAPHHRDCRMLLVQIHTLAQLGAHYAGQDEARAALAALPVPAEQVMQ